MLENLAKWYLSRRGYLVLANRMPMLVVSGYGFAFWNENDQCWRVTFPVKPYIVALNGSYVSGVS